MDWMRWWKLIRSTGFNTVRFFFFGDIKNYISHQPIQNRCQLNDKILEALTNITSEIIYRTG